ncbi:hypothetical protein RV10_GL002358 [Enterococcus pallens]|nr:hypothetical protein RV10_GL002358 [Enterococcus pallens]
MDEQSYPLGRNNLVTTSAVTVSTFQTDNSSIDCYQDRTP